MTLSELAKMLDAIEAGKSPSFNYALHDFVSDLSSYRGRRGERAADMIRKVESSDPPTYED